MKNKELLKEWGRLSDAHLANDGKKEASAANKPTLRELALLTKDQLKVILRKHHIQLDDLRIIAEAQQKKDFNLFLQALSNIKPLGDEDEVKEQERWLKLLEVLMKIGTTSGIYSESLAKSVSELAQLIGVDNDKKM